MDHRILGIEFFNFFQVKQAGAIGQGMERRDSQGGLGDCRRVHKGGHPSIQGLTSAPIWHGFPAKTFPGFQSSVNEVKSCQWI
jgi:hypothetical protein